MNGAPWGWIALIGAVAVLFTASNYDQSGSNKIAGHLRKELKSIVSERDRTQTERNEARDQADAFCALANTLDADLQRSQEEALALKAERDKLRKELASLSQDRQQLQQTVAGLQQERTHTKRNIEQLRHGLQQLLTQADTAANTLASPPPGFFLINFNDTPTKPLPQVKPEKIATCMGTYYPDEPVNDAQ